MDSFLKLPRKPWYTVTIIACNKKKELTKEITCGYSSKEVQNLLYFKDINTSVGNIFNTIRYDFSPDKDNKLDICEVVKRFIKRVQIVRFDGTYILDIENNENNSQYFHKKTLIKTIYSALSKDVKTCEKIFIRFTEDMIFDMGYFEYCVNK